MNYIILRMGSCTLIPMCRILLEKLNHSTGLCTLRNVKRNKTGGPCTQGNIKINALNIISYTAAY